MPFFERPQKITAKDSDKFAKKNEKTTAKDLIFFTFYITIIFGRKDGGGFFARFSFSAVEICF